MLDNFSVSHLTGLRVTVVDQDGAENTCGVVKDSMLPGQWLGFGCESNKLSRHVNLLPPKDPSLLHNSHLCEVVLLGSTHFYHVFAYRFRWTPHYKLYFIRKIPSNCAIILHVLCISSANFNV